jgi:hypothetical protein
MPKNPSAVELGKLRKSKQTPEQRKQAARDAVNARWAKVRAEKQAGKTGKETKQ